VKLDVQIAIKLKPTIAGYSLGVRRLLWEQEAEGSTPSIPTTAMRASGSVKSRSQEMRHNAG
jgi:hypothetical protein